MTTDERNRPMSEIEQGTAGSLFESFLEEEGILEEVRAQALQDVTAWQIEQEMQAQPSARNVTPRV
jgi:hypothetical protein